MWCIIQLNRVNICNKYAKTNFIKEKKNVHG